MSAVDASYRAAACYLGAAACAAASGVVAFLLFVRPVEATAAIGTAQGILLVGTALLGLLLTYSLGLVLVGMSVAEGRSGWREWGLVLLGEDERP